MLYEKSAFEKWLVGAVYTPFETAMFKAFAEANYEQRRRMTEAFPELFGNRLIPGEGVQ